MRLSQAARKFNVGIARIAELLESKGFDIDSKPNTKITDEQLSMLEKEFESSMAVKREAAGLTIGSSHNDIVIKSDKKTTPPPSEEVEDEDEILIYDKSANAKTESDKAEKKEEPAQKEEKSSEPDTISAKPAGLKIIGKIELDDKGRPVTNKPKKEEPVAKEEPVVQKEEPKKEEPVVAKEEPVVQKEEPKKEEPVAKEEPVVQKEEPKKEEPSVVAKTEEPKVEKQENKNITREEPVAKQVETKREEPVAKQEEPKKEEKAPVEKKEVLASKESEIKDKEIKAETDAVGAENETVIEAKADKLQGLKVLGKIDLSNDTSNKKKSKPVASSDEKKGKGNNNNNNKRKRKRVRIQDPERQERKQQQEKLKKEQQEQTNKKQPHSRGNNNNNNSNNNRRDRVKKEEVSKKEVQENYKQTLARLSGGAPNKSGRKYRKEKRDAIAAREAQQQQDEETNVVKVTEFISTNELATLMGVSVNEIIASAMKLGMFVSINQRLDADTITLLTSEFDYEVEFTSAEEETDISLEEEEDRPEDLVDRAPIVTIMGHVDHGKTSLLDYIRKSKVASGEAGGITQHIGAYSVTTESGRDIAFLDTPGHEAFTAMRARGAKLTDVVIVVIAADDSVMPQTKEAINHAQVAEVPIVIAINKVDKPTANPHKIKEELANLNILVEEWGGKVQCQEISAKTGQGVDDLLEMVLLESDILELKANDKKKASGTVVEASLDKGRGYVSTILVQSGTLKIGDIILAGQYQGRVKAMANSKGERVKKAGPSTPVQVLGLNGAPQAGDKVNVLDSEREAREIANKREQILREQSIRATKRTTLSDIGKRIAMGNYHQLNIIIKGDVDGSVEALSDSLLKLSTDEVEVNIIHKAVGPISENDVLLASASDGIVIGFQVRPTPISRRLAEKEDVEIRLYSVIYHAIEDVKDAMEGLLAPDIEEEITGVAEVREVYKISKVGTVAGCYMTEGFIKRNLKIRLIRDGIVVYGGENGGEILALKRFKDDVSEVKQGFECGMSIRNFNDIKVGDLIEGFEEKEVKRTLK